MSTRKSTAFYIVLTAVASLAVGMVIAARLDLTPASSAQTVNVPVANNAPLAGPIDATTFRNIAKYNAGAVVNIQTEVRQRGRDLTEYFGGGDDLLRRFFGGEDPQPPRGGRNRGQPRGQDAPIMEGAGTGFVIDKAGFVLTNNHVIDGAETIRVSFEDDLRSDAFAAKVVGHDVLTDSALLQLTEMPKHPLSEVKWGDSDQMQPGDWVMAIGNPFRLGHSVSVGVISALGRPMGGLPQREQPMLQTDAAINPGNSGGPLLNVRGEVIGMNTAIITNNQSEGNIGIGFAVPSNTVRELLPQLRQGKVVRGRIGVSVTPVDREAFADYGLKSAAGAIVSTVARGSAAEKGGIEPGDVIVEFNGHPVVKSDDLVKTVISTKPGSQVPVKVLRDKQAKTLTVTVDELDLDAEQNRTANRDNASPDAPEDHGAGFGLTLQDLTANVARRLQLPTGKSGAVVTDIDPNSGSATAGIRPGDVILSVNRKAVASAADAGRELQKIPSGGLAQLLLWRSELGELFVPVRKD